MKKSRPNMTGEQLTKTTAEKIFGWKGVHKRDGSLIGKKQDKAGRWRKARVPDYANDQRHAYVIDDRMKQLGRSERYLKELAKISKPHNLPPEWATAEQRSRAALKAIGN
jgi:hypothetical protein